MEPMYEIKCNPICGFKVQSHDEKETIDISLIHLKNKHNKTMPREEVKKMVTTIT